MKPGQLALSQTMEFWSNNLSLSDYQFWRTQAAPLRLSGIDLFVRANLPLALYGAGFGPPGFFSGVVGWDTDLTVAFCLYWEGPNPYIELYLTYETYGRDARQFLVGWSIVDPLGGFRYTFDSGGGIFWVIQGYSSMPPTISFWYRCLRAGWLAGPKHEMIIPVVRAN